MAVFMVSMYRKCDAAAWISHHRATADAYLFALLLNPRHCEATHMSLARITLLLIATPTDHLESGRGQTQESPLRVRAGLSAGVGLTHSGLRLLPAATGAYFWATGEVAGFIEVPIKSWGLRIRAAFMPGVTTLGRATFGFVRYAYIF